MKQKDIKKQSGFAGLEFALMLPVFVIMTWTVIDFGRLLFQYETLTKTTRDAARYMAAATRPPLFASDPYYSNIIAQANNLAVYGSVTGGGTPLVPTLSTSNIAIDYPASGVAGLTLVRVTVTGYSTNFITNVFAAATKDLGTISITMRQVQQ